MVLFVSGGPFDTSDECSAWLCSVTLEKGYILVSWQVIVQGPFFYAFALVRSERNETP